MMNQSAQSLKELLPQKQWGEIPSATRAGGRRTQHGSTAWTSATNLIQPQDGANTGTDKGRVTDIGTRVKLSKMGSIALGEPEDARLTGSTRSLVRRMLGLNIALRKPRTSAMKDAKSVA
jgi:hypothetical protein